MPRCYSHNRPIRQCPTRAACLYRRAVSSIAWRLIRSIGQKDARHRPA